MRWALRRDTLRVGGMLGVLVLLVTATFTLEARLLPPEGDAVLGVRPEDLPYVATVLSAGVVGTLLATRRPRHPVGWLFLALAISIALPAVLDTYARYGALVRPGSLPAAGLVATLSGGFFLIWFALVALILHLTPTGRPFSPRWSTAARLTVVAAALAFSVSLISDEPLDPPFGSTSSPLALPPSTQGVISVLRYGLAMATAAGLLVAGASLLARFVRARDNERRQLQWLALAVVPLPLFVPLAFYASPDHPYVLAVAVGGFMGLVPIAAFLAIIQFHLYDVERLLSRAVTYLLVSAVLAFTFGVVVVSAGRGIGTWAGDSNVPAVLATLAAAVIAVPVHRAFQDGVDRRFNRRRYDALQRVQRFVDDPDPDVTIEDVLRDALGDPGLHVAYHSEDRDDWVLLDGSDLLPDADTIDVRRQERPVALVAYDVRVVDADTARAAVAAATPELENAMLRARLSLQLADVRDSRTRIAAAHVSERRRLERNLHDGAQQRLLALGLELRAAQVNGGREPTRGRRCRRHR